MIDKGDRVYATETIDFTENAELEHIVAGTEGTVTELTGDDCCDLAVEWDSGHLTGVDSGSVALVPALADAPDRASGVYRGAAPFPCPRHPMRGHWSQESVDACEALERTAYARQVIPPA